MSYKRACVRLVNSFVSLVVVLVLLLFGSYSAYALWDNEQIYSAAKDVQLQMQELKPVIEEGEEGPSFEDLLMINPDVRGWVTMDGTNIDFPILQGESNYNYINHDVYGNFALAGSIFLDFRNSPDFSDSYNLTYGHHMANSNMYGDLDLYEEESFFRKNTTGLLMTKDAVYNLNVLAVLMVSASDDNIFEVGAERDTDDILRYIKENALYLSDLFPDFGSTVQFFVLSTCSSDFTDARTIVITSMNRYI